jgi:pyridoxal phosphate enzyme (YggS family)
MAKIEENVEAIRERIALSCQRAGRNDTDVQLVAATKGVSVESIEKAISAGVKIIGENKIQEALGKYAKIADPVHWHMIGHLQTNKVKKALGIFELVQSVDSCRLAEELSSKALQRKRVIDILVEVNTSGEHTKFGIEPHVAPQFVQEISSLAGIRVRGLMTIAIFAADPEVVRPCFIQLRRLKDEIEAKGIAQLELLSMGMTSDFEVAIEEGSNMVRIGTGIFGARNI